MVVVESVILYSIDEHDTGEFSHSALRKSCGCRRPCKRTSWH